MQQQEQLWQHHLKTTFAFFMQPGIFSSTSVCARAIVKHLTALPPGIDHSDSNGGWNERAVHSE
jgi:hypothetical protein